MKKDDRNNDEGKQIMERIEAVKRRIPDGEPTP
jgi:hypothetical protein